MTFRAEIASLHEDARSEQERVTLLEAHRNLVAVGPHCFAPETWSNLLPVTQGEYKLFLSREAMEDGIMNPVLLERVVRREVENGRLSEDDDFYKLSVAASTVLGDSAGINTHKCKRGDWFCFGAIATAILAWGFLKVGISPIWLIVFGFAVGTFINGREIRRIKSEVLARRG